MNRSNLVDAKPVRHTWVAPALVRLNARASENNNSPANFEGPLGNGS